jgi:hypothetical protein
MVGGSRLFAVMAPLTSRTRVKICGSGSGGGWPEPACQNEDETRFLPNLLCWIFLKFQQKWQLCFKPVENEWRLTRRLTTTYSQLDSLFASNSSLCQTAVLSRWVDKT